MTLLNAHIALYFQQWDLSPLFSWAGARAQNVSLREKAVNNKKFTVQCQHLQHSQLEVQIIIITPFLVPFQTFSLLQIYFGSYFFKAQFRVIAIEKVLVVHGLLLKDRARRRCRQDFWSGNRGHISTLTPVEEHVSILLYPLPRSSKATLLVKHSVSSRVANAY